MASSTALYISPSSSSLLTRKPHSPSLSQTAFFVKPFSVKASSTSLDASLTDKPSTLSKTSNWQWKYKDNSINIYYEEHERGSAVPTKDILMIPTISDVSTVEEWRVVANDIVQRDGGVNWRATIVDWPGLGYSDRPKMDYNSEVMEKFLVDFISAPDSPLKCRGG